MNGERRGQYEYEEIDLKGYVRVLAKRKLLIFLFAVAGMFAAGLLSFGMPKLYTTRSWEVIIEVGTIEREMVKIPSQIIGELEQNLFAVPLAEKLHIPLPQVPKIKASSPPNTNLVKLEIRSSDGENAKKILDALVLLILQEQEEKIRIRTTSIKDQIILLEKSVEILQKDKTQSSNAPVLVSRIFDLKREVDAITHPAVRKPFDPSQGPVSQSRVAFTIVLGALLGLFLGVCFAFVADWWKKNPNKKTP